MLGKIIAKTAPQKYDQFDEKSCFIMTFKVFFCIVFVVVFFSTKKKCYNHFIIMLNNSTHKTNNSFNMSVECKQMQRPVCNANS